jgi:hypothetical protein
MVAVEKDQVVRVQVGMVPGGSFSGRVLDPSGKPVSETPVQVFRTMYQNGTASLQAVNSRTTDDRGDYRVYRLPPGQYFAAATPRRASPIRPGDPAGAPVTTYYPNASDRSRATPISVGAGDELTGINIQLQTATAVKVSGKVTSSFPLAPAANALGQARESVAGIALIPKRRNGPMDERNGTSISARPDGTFDIFNVMPGSYELIAHFPIEPYKGWGPNNPPSSAFGPWAFGRTSIEVGNSNVENVAVVIHYGNDLNGRLVVDGKLMAANVRISVQADPEVLSAADVPTAATFAQISNYQAPINPDGTFTIPLLPEGRYRFQIVMGGYTPPAAGRGARGLRGLRGQQPEPAIPSLPLLALPYSAFVADIRQGSVSVYDDGITISAEAINPVDVVVSTNPGTIEGTVTAADQKPASAQVVLVPPESRRQNTALYRTARSDPQGRFVVTNVPPGLYTAFAWESVSPGAFQSAEFLARYADRGANVSVTAGNRSNVNLTVIPIEPSGR